MRGTFDEKSDWPSTKVTLSKEDIEAVAQESDEFSSPFFIAYFEAGSIAKEGIHMVTETEFRNTWKDISSQDKTCCYGSDGALHKGQRTVNGKRHYFGKEAGAAE